MIILKNTSKKQEAYTPLEKFGDRMIDLQTFFEGIRINFKRELTLSVINSGKESVTAVVGPSDVNITNTGITIQNLKAGMIVTLPFKSFDLSAIEEVSNASAIDYIFILKSNRRMFYKISVK
jgi:hypothetical protein